MYSSEFFEWTRLLGTSSSDAANSITTGSDGSIYIAGKTNEDLNGETKRGTRDAFLIKRIEIGNPSDISTQREGFMFSANVFGTGGVGAHQFPGSTTQVGSQSGKKGALLVFDNGS